MRANFFERHFVAKREGTRCWGRTDHAILEEPAISRLPRARPVKILVEQLHRGSPTLGRNRTKGELAVQGGARRPTILVLLAVVLPVVLSLLTACGLVGKTGTSSITSGSGLHITTTSLPPGAVGNSYNATLSATGGTTPYSWSVTSGQLPTGLTLSTAGTISGTPTVVGTFTFQVQVRDNAGLTSSNSFFINILSTTACGGPFVYCSRTDLNLSPSNGLIGVPPQVGPNVCSAGSLSSCGNLTGANTIVTDPDFGNRILRLTDANTDSNATNITYITSGSGAGDRNKCGPPDANGIILCAIDADGGGTGKTTSDPVFAINTQTFQATKLYGPGQGQHISWFSYTNPYIGYVWPPNAPIVQKVDFSDGHGNLNTSFPPTVTTVVDFSASPNCLYSGFRPTSVAAGGMSLDEQNFSAAYSDGGAQGTASWVVYWTLGQGCRQWRTTTAQITGDWGPVGTMSLGTSDEFTMHGGTQGKGGANDSTGDNRFMTVAPDANGCVNGTPCFLEFHSWYVPSLTVNHCGGTSQCAAHGSFALAHETQACSVPGYNGQQVCLHPLLNPASSFTQLTPNNPSGYGTVGIDRHPSWNAVAADEVEILTDASFALNFNPNSNGFDGPLPSAWYDEIMGYRPFLPQVVYRFAHTYNTNCGISGGSACRFNLTDTIGSGTPNGRYFLWVSSWGRTLGAENGSASCTEDSTATRGGTLCRGDVFMVELK